MNNNNCGNYLLGNVYPNYITMYNSAFVAREGSNTVANMPVKLVAPYKQILRSSLTLKPGQCKYLLNHLGLGDNVTFLSIVVNYAQKSIIESDNFLQYSYYSDSNNWLSFAQMLVLTGNSENRVEQLYLTNPNSSYAVQLDIMIGIIDDENEFFGNTCDEIAESNLSKFINLKCTDIITWAQGVTIAVLAPNSQPQLYITIADINGLSRDTNTITLDDRSSGTIIMQFISVDQAIRAFSKFSYIIENPVANLNDFGCEDINPPCITFTYNVYPLGTIPIYQTSPADLNYNWNYCPPMTGDDVNPEYLMPSPGIDNCEVDILNFEAFPMSLMGEGNNGIINKDILISYLILTVIDNMDGAINLGAYNIIIKDTDNNQYVNIIEPNIYYVYFNITDLSGNSVSNELNIKIIIDL